MQAFTSSPARTSSGPISNGSCIAPIEYWDEKKDYLIAFLAGMKGDRARAAHPALARWMKTTRLNPLSGLASYADDARVIEARERIKRFAAMATTNLENLVSDAERA